jgi:mono/diheme cytochrome c family protein
MRNTRIVICFLLFTCLQIACSPKRTAGLEGKIDLSDARTKNGQEKYMRFCESCHPAGSSGLGPAIISTPSFLKRFQVRHGLGTMPAFKKDVLPKKDLDDVIRYIKAIKKS